MHIHNKRKPSNNKSTSIYGINSVRESLLSGNVSLLYTLERLSGHELVGLANKKGVELKYVDSSMLNKLAGNDHHQGFVAKVKSNAIFVARFIVVRERPFVQPGIVLY